MSALGIALFIGATLSFGVFGVLVYRSREKDGNDAAGRRLKHLAGRLGDQKSSPSDLSILRDFDGRARTAPPALARLMPRFLLGYFELLLYRANSNIGVWRLLSLSLILGWLFFLLGTRVFFDWGIALTLASIAVVTPTYIYRYKARQMLSNFESSFPEALALVARSLRGGHALQRSLRIVADEMTGPVAKEFTLVADELSLGRDLGAVLHGLAQRLELSDVDLFASGVLVQREYGGNLAEVVDKLANMIRGRFKFHAKVRALTSTNRSSAMILVAIPFVFVGLMFFANQDFIRPLWETSQGHSLAMVAAALVGAGYGMARKVSRVDA